MPARKAPPRRSGRPPRDEDRASREALLDAAIDLIAERGAAASTLVAIAARAGVTPAMVHYYFRNRESLLDAVADERLARFPRHVFGTALPDAPASEVVTAVVRRAFEAVALMPWMPSIWIREIVSDGGALRSRMLQHFPAGPTRRLVEIVARDQGAGRVPSGIEPRLAFLTIAGVAMLPLAVRSLWSRLPGLGDLDVRALETHACTVLTAGLAPARKGRKR